MTNKQLAKEILDMARWDQLTRKRGSMDVEQVDKRNTARMKEIVKEFGWPTVSLVGKEAAHMAWLLVQHADHDVEFQEYCLKLMRKYLKNGGVSKGDVAYLTDRILVNKKKQQIYGTQFCKNETGEMVPYPIRDVSRLDERRLAVGLEEFEKYSKRMHKHIL